MHTDNPFAQNYKLEKLALKNLDLRPYLISNPKGEPTIDFSNPNSVYQLNRALLLSHFGLTNYLLPQGYLIPPIPGRLEYLLQLNDLVKQLSQGPSKRILKGLDIGSGANGIYCLLGAQHFNWQMIGAESDKQAVEISKKNIEQTPGLSEKIEVRLQENKSNLLKGIITPGEYFDFTVCNPPFHSSAEESLKGTRRKWRNLNSSLNKQELQLNFQGQANELWCNGGEALFVKRLIKESILFKGQVKVFSSLVAKSENLPKLEKQLLKLKANYRLLPLELGNKKSRVLCWWFD